MAEDASLRVVVATDGFLEPDTTPTMPHELRYAPAACPGKVQAALTGADALICRRVNIGAGFLDGIVDRRLRLIQQVGTGTDRIDLAAAQARGIAVANTPEATATAVVEHVFMLILACLRDLRAQWATIERGAWSHAGDWERNELAGRTLGIFGFGAIGRGIAKRALAFEARVLACGRPGKAIEDIPAGVEAVEFPRLLRESDILVIAASLTAQTRGIIDTRVFASMRSTAILINIARGAIVDEAALVEALAAGRIAGAALDAFAVEPLPTDSPLRRLPNVVLTPHSAGASRQSRERIWAQMLANLDRLASGRPLCAVVNG